MTTDELKGRCREVIETHLKSKGYPNMSRRAILNELKPMWIKMEQLGLMEYIKAEGWTYQMYCDVAIKKAQEAAIFDHLSGFVRANPGRVK